MSSHDALAPELAISPSALQHVLEGVVAATLANDAEVRHLHQWIKSRESALSLPEWQALLTSTFAHNEICLRLAGLAAGISLLRECYHRQLTASAANIESVWDLIYGALTSEVFSSRQFRTCPSTQGLLALPLCTLRENEVVIEEYRLHVWLPDERRRTSSSLIHSDAVWTQSWVLAGEAETCVYSIEPVALWEDTNYFGCRVVHTAYSSHSTSLRIRSAQQFCAHQASRAVSSRKMSHAIPMGSFHNTKVAADAVYATICCFDLSRGVVGQETTMLHSKSETLPIRLRVVESRDPKEIARVVQSVHEWELLMEQADHYAQRGEWEHALKALNSALHLCDSSPNLQNMARYRYLVIDWLGFANRCLGRFDQARDVMESALAHMGASCPQRVGICAELGVVYRHMNRLEDAKRAFEDQYDTAKRFRLEQAVCRAVGNLGMVSYQLFLLKKDTGLLDTAIDQLNERVKTARDLKHAIAATSTEFSGEVQYANTLEAIGLARLSLCYTARGETRAAVSAAFESFKITSLVQDSSVVAISRFFYGRALLSHGQHDMALEQFNIQDGCTCAIAFCKEPSQEHCQYLGELADVGADFTITDDQGYTALDHAVFNDDRVAEDIVLGELKRGLSDNVEYQLGQLRSEARLRKGYREIFQDKMRPILFGGGDGKLHKMRRAYTDTLASDKDKNAAFDGLKYVAYRHFVTLGRFPRSSDHLTQQFSAGSSPEQVKFIIFFSYRWINSNPWAKTPDDAENTQYLRTIAAVEDFLKIHPEVNVQTLGIWIDVACIDQENPMSGIAALPMVLAQCDALISLVDANYYNRAWCSVEVMMVQALRKTYNLHVWYEHVLDQTGESEDGKDRWILRKGPMDIEIDLAKKKLRFEEDRSKIMFLERQCKLLC